MWHLLSCISDPREEERDFSALVFVQVIILCPLRLLPAASPGCDFKFAFRAEAPASLWLGSLVACKMKAGGRGQRRQQGANPWRKLGVQSPGCGCPGMDTIAVALACPVTTEGVPSVC